MKILLLTTLFASDFTATEQEKQSLIEYGCKTLQSIKNNELNVLGFLPQNTPTAGTTELEKAQNTLNSATAKTDFYNKLNGAYDTCLKSIVEGIEAKEKEKAEKWQNDYKENNKTWWGMANNIGGTVSSLTSLRPSNLVHALGASNDQEYITRRQNHWAAITSIAWALDDIAKNRGEGFSRGSFTIKDQGKNLTNFLLSYVALTYNPPLGISLGITSTPTLDSLDAVMNLPLFSAGTSSRFAYSRNSSHCASYADKKQFGIDMRIKNTDTYSRELLPHGHRHILFAPFNEKDALFFKMEEWGMGNADEMALHTVNYANSGTVSKNTTRREKDLPRTTHDWYKKIKGVFPPESMTLEDARIALKSNTNVDLDLQDQFGQYTHADIRRGNEVIVDLATELPK